VLKGEGKGEFGDMRGRRALEKGEKGSASKDAIFLTELPLNWYAKIR